MTTELKTHALQFSALPMEKFAPLFALSDAELAARGMRRVVADSNPGFPCRVSLVDAQPGETLILLNFLHHDVAGPYCASGPIYVREHATPPALAAGELPEVVRHRLLSLRGYDATGMLLEADVVEGSGLAARAASLFTDPELAYIHVHNAKPGCYSCRIDRAGA